MGHHVTPEFTTSISFFVSHKTPYHARGNHCDFQPNPYLGKHRISLGTAFILRMCSAHILSFFATSLINNSGLVFIRVKIMNVFTCGEEISKLTAKRSN